VTDAIDPHDTPFSDFLAFELLLEDRDRELVSDVRAFMTREVEPVINGYWTRAAFPHELVPGIAELGIAGLAYDGPGCPARGALVDGMVASELARVDPSIGTFMGVHGGLAMGSIMLCGSDEQRERWLPAMARMELIGAFGLTEPDVGSAISAGLATTARRDGDGWVLNGEKKWIGNAAFADLVIIWARDEAEEQVKGFVVEKDNPGYKATKIGGKVSLRCVQNADITLTDCRVSEDARLQKCNSFADVAKVLMGTRNFVAWGGLGNAVSVYDCALTYTQRRTQFGKPIAKSQMVQSALVEMLGDVTAMQLYCIRLGRLIDEGKMTDTMAALAKYFCTVKARHVCRLGRDLLGGNGITLDFHVMRHLCDMEALITYEGTVEMQTCIVGRQITGQSAFA
jgi:glutaryl-CoA dehydrogenase